ncbi:MAG: cold shock domain-containing protein [Acidimicrobiaceae bacterium]|nr:cold shock domain-containing protein [Acidimicrobiaceae bacterium]
MSETGVVESFDDHRGDGWIRDERGRPLFLHCVMITDGSRTIQPGTRVRFVRSTGLLGADEAREVRPT